MKEIYLYLKWKIKKFFSKKTIGDIDVGPVINIFVDLLTTEELTIVRNVLEVDFLNMSIPDRLSGMSVAPDVFLNRFSSVDNYIATYTQIATKLVTASAICGNRSVFRNLSESVSELSNDLDYLKFTNLDEFSLSVKDNVLMDILVFLTLMGGFLYTVVNEKIQHKDELISNISGVIKPLNR